MICKVIPPSYDSFDGGDAECDVDERGEELVIREGWRNVVGIFHQAGMASIAQPIFVGGLVFFNSGFGFN